MIGRRVESADELVLPGDYLLIAEYEPADGNPAVLFRLPFADDDERLALPGARSLATVTSPPHTFRECDDGSLEIRDSILCRFGPSDGQSWHGYLDEGHSWREV